MSNLSVNSIVDASGGSTTTINGYTPTLSNMAGRNRIINGAMVIDQRNAGALYTPTGGAITYGSVDRWQFAASAASKFTVQQNSGSVTPPTGYTNYLGAVSLSAYTVGSTEQFNISQPIEGTNFSDLAFGTASAQSVTLSFWVRSSLTGQFGVLLSNAAKDRVYPVLYTISSANTWEHKTVVFPGCTTGTWGTTSAMAGAIVSFGLGVGSSASAAPNAWSTASNIYGVTGATSVVGTNGATFYITGVQLEAGSVATPFERRPYGTELALAQRYFYAITFSNFSYGSYLLQKGSYYESCPVVHPVQMRAAPSMTNSGTEVYAYNSSTPITPSSVYMASGVLNWDIRSSTTNSSTWYMWKITLPITASAEL